jgi:hypothetical protein
MKGLGFYSTAAQVIPLLSLLLLVEVRTSTLGRTVYETWFVPGLLLLQSVAELYLLLVLKSESDPGSVGFWFTIMVLGVTGGFVGAYVMTYVKAARVLARNEHDAT